MKTAIKNIFKEDENGYGDAQHIRELRDTREPLGRNDPDFSNNIITLPADEEALKKAALNKKLRAAGDILAILLSAAIALGMVFSIAFI